MRKHFIIGVDFGTTYSSIFEYDEKNNSPIGLTGSCSSYFYPTVVAYHRGSWYFGEQALKKSQNIVDIKRMFGMLENSPLLTESKRIWELGNIVLRKSSDKGLIEIGLKFDIKSEGPAEWKTPEEIASKFIRFLFNDNQIPITKTQKLVVTCPADFNTIQRKVLMKAVEEAGFSPEYVNLLHEPSAAAISYMIDTGSDEHFSNFLVVDFGGGTLDLSLLDISRQTFTIKSSGGDRQLGGRDFDNAIFEWAKSNFEEIVGRSLTKAELKLIKSQCQDAKISINQNPKVSIEISTEDEEDFSLDLGREVFEQISQSFLDRAINVIDDFITKDLKMNKSSIDAIYLVGGTSNLYIFRDRIKQYFNRAPIDYQMPREAIARGACYFSAMIENAIDSPLKDMNFNQRLSHPIGTDIIGGKFSVILPKNSPIPTSGKQDYFSVKDNQKALHVGIYECEEIYLNNCIPIDEFKQKVKRLPKGKARITIKMEIDKNGILHTSSKFKDLENDEYDEEYDFETVGQNLNLSDCASMGDPNLSDLFT